MLYVGSDVLEGARAPQNFFAPPSRSGKKKVESYVHDIEITVREEMLKL